jgi:hypothetical protein
VKINLRSSQAKKVFTRESNECVMIPEVWWWLRDNGVMYDHVNWGPGAYGNLPSWIAFKHAAAAVHFKLTWL